MSTLEWQEARHALSAGAMDRAHKEFVDLTNQLAEADPASEEKRLALLLAHCEDHFAQEHEWMLRSRLPGADNHLRDHDGVVALLRSTLAELRAGKRGVGREVADSLATWFDHHAATMDAALALHMQQTAPKTQTGIPAVGG